MFVHMKNLAAIIFSVLLCAINMSDAAALDFCQGTFTNFHFNTESGDLSGVEIRIVDTLAGKQATIQFSEGEPSTLTVTKVSCDGAHLSFKLPADEGRATATFHGITTSKKLVGEFVFDTGARDKVVLERRTSYWDKTH